MTKARMGHFVEAEILEALGVDMLNESEVLAPADPSSRTPNKKTALSQIIGYTIYMACIRTQQHEPVYSVDVMLSFSGYNKSYFLKIC